MEKCLKSSENRNERILENASIVMLSLFAVLAYLDVISAVVPFVLAAYGVMSVLSIAYIIFYFMVRKKFFSFDIPNVGFLCFALFTILSMIVKKGAIDRDAVAIFNLLQIVSVCLAVFVLKDDICRFIEYFCYLVIAFSLFVLLNSLSVFTEFRSQGITPNTNALGALMAISMLCILYLLIQKKGFLIDVMLVGLLLFYGAALFKTGSRTAMLSCFAGLFVFSFYFLYSKINERYRKLILTVMLIVFLIFLILLCIVFYIVRGGGSSLLSRRDVIWKASFDALSGNWMLGFGGNSKLMISAYERVGDSHALGFASSHFLHNIYIQILVEYGALALISFLCLVLALFVKNIVFWVRNRFTFDDLSIFCLPIFVFYCIHGLAESSILYIGGPEQFTFVFASALMYLNCKKESI